MDAVLFSTETFVRILKNTSFETFTVKQISRIADMAKFFWSRVAGPRMATLLKRRLHHGFAKSPYYLFFRTTADSCFPLKFFRQTENVGKVQRPETCR